MCPGDRFEQAKNRFDGARVVVVVLAAAAAGGTGAEFVYGRGAGGGPGARHPGQSLPGSPVRGAGEGDRQRRGIAQPRYFGGPWGCQGPRPALRLRARRGAGQGAVRAHRVRRQLGYRAGDRGRGAPVDGQPASGAGVAGGGWAPGAPAGQRRQLPRHGGGPAGRICPAGHPLATAPAGPHRRGRATPAGSLEPGRGGHPGRLDPLPGAGGAGRAPGGPVIRRRGR